MSEADQFVRQADDQGLQYPSKMSNLVGGLCGSIQIREDVTGLGEQAEKNIAVQSRNHYEMDERVRALERDSADHRAEIKALIQGRDDLTRRLEALERRPQILAASAPQTTPNRPEMVAAVDKPSREEGDRGRGRGGAGSNGSRNSKQGGNMVTGLTDMTLPSDLETIWSDSSHSAFRRIFGISHPSANDSTSRPLVKEGSRATGEWLFTTAANIHGSPDLSDFEWSVPLPSPLEIQTSHGTIIRAERIGRIRFPMVGPDGKMTVTLNTALYIPKLASKIFSGSLWFKIGGRLGTGKDITLLTPDGRRCYAFDFGRHGFMMAPRGCEITSTLDRLTS